jgi:predicted PhzF superfamily epimerase YddE/YHI9
MVRQVDTYGPASGSNGMDTVVVAMKKQPEVIQVNPNTEVLSHVKKLKKQLESDLEKNK